MRHRKGRVVRKLVTVNRGGRKSDADSVKLAVWKKVPGRGATNPRVRQKKG